MRHSGRITTGMRCGRTTPQDSAFSSPDPPEWPSQEGSGLTASVPVSDVSACTNGVWPPLRPVQVVQKSKPSTMLPSNVQFIDLPMDWMMRQLNGCSTPAPRSSAAKQWFEQLAQKKEEHSHYKLQCKKYLNKQTHK